MNAPDANVANNAGAQSRWLSVIGIGDDGWDGLGKEAQDLIADAELVIGGARHLEMLPEVQAEARTWDGTFSNAVAALKKERGRAVVVLASGDPLLYGVGVLIARRFSRRELRVIPHLSAFAQVCARMVWPQLEVQQVSLCGRPVERVRGALGPGQKVVALSADGATPAAVALYLVANGYGASTLHVFEHLGGTREAHHEMRATDVSADAHFADLNTIAIECEGDATAVSLPHVSGLPDELFAHDGQMTKQEVRALTLAELAPRPGELLWDIGLGSGSISIEWLRSGYGMRSFGVEKNAERAARARQNAETFGVAGLTVIEKAAGEAIGELERPDAIFIGGGLTTERIVERCWEALLPGGRLVANTVTLESEAVLLASFSSLGGSLTRLSIDRADPVGAMTGWRPAMTVTQWVITKPHNGSGT